jgi:hypothetical protein
MNGPASFSAEKAPLSNGEGEISSAIEQAILNQPAQIEADANRIRSSIARLTSTSIDGLEGLTSELHQLQTFLKSEVERVQGEIESALAGIKIIIETIAPLRSTLVPVAPAPSPRPVRAGGPALGNIEPAQLRR